MTIYQDKQNLTYHVCMIESKQFFPRTGLDEQLLSSSLFYDGFVFYLRERSCFHDVFPNIVDIPDPFTFVFSEEKYFIACTHQLGTQQLLHQFFLCIFLQ